MKTVEIISIPVRNQENAKQFYVEKAGFELLFEGATPDGNKWIQVRIPGDTVSFTIVSGDEHAKPGTLKGTVILTEDIRRDISRLNENGIRTENI